MTTTRYQIRASVLPLTGNRRDESTIETVDDERTAKQRARKHLRAFKDGGYWRDPKMIVVKVTTTVTEEVISTID